MARIIFCTLSFSAVAASCMEASNPPSYKAGYGQARSQGGFEGVRMNPPCSLAKFIFNETAAVLGTIIQLCSHHAAATRGSHIHVACRSVCDRDQEF